MREYLYQVITGKKQGFVALVIRSVLLGLSFIYFVLVKIILFFYGSGLLKSHRLGCKVISVGNITWGGTGKTPLVKTLVKLLIGQGRKPAVIIRGYKSNPRADGNQLNYRLVGDEAAMLLGDLAVPVLVGRDRVGVVKRALRDLNIDTVILDDGFQHWRLRRNLDIVCIDATNPFGNGLLIPRGILREPLSGLKRAGVFFLTKTDLAGGGILELKNRLSRINPSALMVESIHRPVGFHNILKKDEFIPREEVSEERVCLVCSIGNPAAFEKTIVSLKLNPVLRFFFMDHHDYKKDQIDEIIAACSQDNIKTIITTSKDAVRLNEHLVKINTPLKILVLKIEIVITKGKDEFLSRLSRIYSA